MNIALIGYGKMGKAIEEIALQKGHTITLKIDLENQHELSADNLIKADVAIEFTGPETAADNIYTCLDAGIPVISGSTGWLSKLPVIEKHCLEKNGSFLYASNFSIGVNIFFELNSKLAKLMARFPEYEVSIDEIHHTGKKDSPSGTAITLAEKVISELPRKSSWVNNQPLEGSQLQIISRRIDPAPGTHTVKYSSSIDDIEIIHTAHNRKGFASGALMAAEYIVNRKGIHTMKDVLSIV